MHKNTKTPMDLACLQDAFTSLVRNADPQHLGQFFLWLDLKVSQYKIHGRFSPDKYNSPKKVWLEKVTKKLFDSQNEQAALTKACAEASEQSTSAVSNPITTTPDEKPKMQKMNDDGLITPARERRNPFDPTKSLSYSESKLSTYQLNWDNFNVSALFRSGLAPLFNMHAPRLPLNLFPSLHPEVPSEPLDFSNSKIIGSTCTENVNKSALDNNNVNDFKVNEQSYNIGEAHQAIINNYSSGLNDKIVTINNNPIPSPSKHQNNKETVKSLLREVLSRPREPFNPLNLPAPITIAPEMPVNSGAVVDDEISPNTVVVMPEDPPDSRQNNLKQEEEKQFCTLCQKPFNYRSSYRRHMKIHDGIFSHECFVCRRKFTRKEHYKRHKCSRKANKPNRGMNLHDLSMNSEPDSSTYTDFKPDLFSTPTKSRKTNKVEGTNKKSNTKNSSKKNANVNANVFINSSNMSDINKNIDPADSHNINYMNASQSVLNSFTPNFTDNVKRNIMNDNKKQIKANTTSSSTTDSRTHDGSNEFKSYNNFQEFYLSNLHKVTHSPSKTFKNHDFPIAANSALIPSNVLAAGLNSNAADYCNNINNMKNANNQSISNVNNASNSNNKSNKNHIDVNKCQSKYNYSNIDINNFINNIFNKGIQNHNNNNDNNNNINSNISHNINDNINNNVSHNNDHSHNNNCPLIFSNKKLNENELKLIENMKRNVNSSNNNKNKSSSAQHDNNITSLNNQPLLALNNNTYMTTSESASSRLTNTFIQDQIHDDKSLESRRKSSTPRKFVPDRMETNINNNNNNINDTNNANSNYNNIVNESGTNSNNHHVEANKNKFNANNSDNFVGNINCKNDNEIVNSVKDDYDIAANDDDDDDNDNDLSNEMMADDDDCNDVVDDDYCDDVENGKEDFNQKDVTKTHSDLTDKEQLTVAYLQQQLLLKQQQLKQQALDTDSPLVTSATTVKGASNYNNLNIKNSDGDAKTKQTKYLKLKKEVVLIDGKPCFQCPLCGRVFHRNSNFSRHMRIHRGQFSYTCPMCGKGFYRKEHFLKHKQCKGHDSTTLDPVLLHSSPDSINNLGTTKKNNNNNNNRGNGNYISDVDNFTKNNINNKNNANLYDERANENKSDSGSLINANITNYNPNNDKGISNNLESYSNAAVPSIEMINKTEFVR